MQWKCEDVPSEKEKQNIEDFVKGSTENNVHLDDINMQDFVDDQSHSGAQLLKITFTQNLQRQQTISVLFGKIVILSTPVAYPLFLEQHRNSS